MSQKFEVVTITETNCLVRLEDMLIDFDVKGRSAVVDYGEDNNQIETMSIERAWSIIESALNMSQ